MILVFSRRRWIPRNSISVGRDTGFSIDGKIGEGGDNCRAGNAGSGGRKVGSDRNRFGDHVFGDTVLPERALALRR